MAPGTLRTAAVRVAQVGVALGIFALLWHIADGEEALRRLRGANPWWLVASFAALTVQTVLSALRWQLTARQLGIVLNRPTALREYYLSQIVNQTLPGGILGDLSRAVRARAQAGVVASGQAVLLERLAGQAALFAIMVIAFGAALAMPRGVDWPLSIVVTFAVVVLCLLGGAFALVFIAKNSSGRLGRGLASFQRAGVRAFHPPTVRWRQIGLSIGTALCNVAGFLWAAWAIGSELSVFTALAVVPMILLAMLIPLTIGGWGLREGAAAALFVVAGATAAEGLAASVAFGLVFLTASLPGLIFVVGAKQKRLANDKPGEENR